MSDEFETAARLEALRDIVPPALGWAEALAALALAFGAGLFFAIALSALISRLAMPPRRAPDPLERLEAARTLPPSQRAAALSALMREIRANDGARPPADLAEALYRPGSSLAALDRLDRHLADALAGAR